MHQTTLHNTETICTKLHYTTLKPYAPNYTTQHWNHAYTPNYTTQHWNHIHQTTLHNTETIYTKLHYTTLKPYAPNYTTQHWNHMHQLHYTKLKLYASITPFDVNLMSFSHKALVKIPNNKWRVDLIHVPFWHELPHPWLQHFSWKPQS
jgi:hypothetical protein